MGILVVFFTCLLGCGLAQQVAAEETIGPVYPEADPAVARITVTGTSEISYGSGSLVHVSEHHGLVVTNWHVIQDMLSGKADSINVSFPDGMNSPAVVLVSDSVWDLAALAIWRPQAEPIPVGAVADVPPIGEMLRIAGYGQGYYRTTQGRCTSYMSPSPFRPKEFLEMSATARNGDSGGPILNSDGTLVGVLWGSDGQTGFGPSYTLGAHCGRVREFLTSAQAPFAALSPPQTETGISASPASMETQDTTTNRSEYGGRSRTVDRSSEEESVDEQGEGRAESTNSSYDWTANTTNRTYGSQEEYDSQEEFGSQEENDEPGQGSRTRTDSSSEDSEYGASYPSLEDDANSEEDSSDSQEDRSNSSPFGALINSARAGFADMTGGLREPDLEGLGDEMGYESIYGIDEYEDAYETEYGPSYDVGGASDSSVNSTLRSPRGVSEAASDMEDGVGEFAESMEDRLDQGEEGVRSAIGEMAEEYDESQDDYNYNENSYGGYQREDAEEEADAYGGYGGSYGNEPYSSPSQSRDASTSQPYTYSPRSRGATPRETRETSLTESSQRDSRNSSSSGAQAGDSGDTVESDTLEDAEQATAGPQIVEVSTKQILIGLAGMFIALFFVRPFIS